MDQPTDYLPQRYKPENVNIKHKGSLSLQDKIALAITSAVGTMYAVYFFILFMGLWLIWQLFFSTDPFDPYPFSFLLFIGNIAQLLLMPLIMVGQNLQGKHAMIRAEEEYKTTNSIYKDIEILLLHLDRQSKLIEKQEELLEKLSKKLRS